MRLVKIALETALCIVLTTMPTAAQDPSAGRARLDRARQLEASGKIAEAVEELRAAVKSNLEPEIKGECWYHMGRMFLSDRVRPNGFLATYALENALRTGALRGEMRASAERMLVIARGLRNPEKEVATDGALKRPLELEAAGQVDEAIQELWRAVRSPDSDVNSQVFFHIGRPARLQLQDPKKGESCASRDSLRQ